MNEKIIEFYLLDLICKFKQTQTLDLELQTIDEFLSDQIQVLETQILSTNLVISDYEDYKRTVLITLKNKLNTVTYNEIEFSLEDVSILFSLKMNKSLAGQLQYNAYQIQKSFYNAIDELIIEGIVKKYKELKTINKAIDSKELITNFINNFNNTKHSNYFKKDDIQTLIISVYQ